jgi:hypothetical protein
MKLHYASRGSYEIPLSRTAKPSISNAECRFTIDELWMSLPAVVACLLRHSSNGYEGRIGHYGEVGSLCSLKNKIERIP